MWQGLKEVWPRTGAGNTMECVKFTVPASLVPRIPLVRNMNIARQGEPSIFSHVSTTHSKKWPEF